MTTDNDLPPEVLALVELGEPLLNKLRADRKAEFETTLAGVMDAVRRALRAEPGYHPSMADGLGLYFVEPDESKFTVRIGLAGCTGIHVAVRRRLRGEQTFRVMPGFHVEEDPEGDFATYESLAVAAAAARQAWLEGQHEAEMLVGGGGEYATRRAAGGDRLDPNARPDWGTDCQRGDR